MYRCLTALAAAIAIAAIAVPALGSDVSSAAVRRDPVHKVTNSTSTNWSGYAATGSTFTSVSASWTQPTAICAGSSYSSFWVGLDGDGSSTVEQTGSSADCSSAGLPSYYAWYEMYPKFPTNLPGPVKPGDAFTASVTTDAVGRFTLTISDTSEPWTFTTTQRLKSAALASAEVIAEAPSSRSGVLPLTDFGTVNFTGSTVNGASLSAFNPDRIDMVSGSTVKAQTGSISSNGSFSVTWKHS
jgi:peptidase A4-like protein